MKHLFTLEEVPRKEETREHELYLEQEPGDDEKIYLMCRTHGHTILTITPNGVSGWNHNCLDVRWCEGSIIFKR